LGKSANGGCQEDISKEESHGNPVEWLCLAHKRKEDQNRIFTHS
jgi:hypothetical protein